MAWRDQNLLTISVLYFQTTTEASKVKVNSPPKTTKSPANSKPSKQQPAQHKETPGTQSECSGDCVNGLIALFCDDIDADAFCPNEGSCCITQDEKLQPTTPKVTTPVSYTTRSILRFIDHQCSYFSHHRHVVQDFVC